MVDGFEEREQSYYDQIRKLLAVLVPASEFFQTVVNAPFRDPLTATYAELGMLMLFFVNTKKQTVFVKTISQTEQANSAVKMAEVPLLKLSIPLSNADNLIVKAIKEQKQIRTDGWEGIFVPALSAESARFSQAEAGIAYSIIAPFKRRNIKGALVFGFFKQSDNPERTKRFVQAYVDILQDSAL